MNMKKYIFPVLLMLAGLGLATSCEDMLDKGNDNVLYATDNHLTSAADTVNSYTGILRQLQKIAVRTNLFGELRGDLVEVQSNATTDLQDIANFNVTDDNAYNRPGDYYAIINNCNYYLANADDSLKNNKGNYIFKAEKDAVRGIRAWVYLQLAQIYGANIPVLLDPVFSELDADINKARKASFTDICDIFIDDLSQVNTSLSIYDLPSHGGSNRVSGNYDEAYAPTSLCVIPIDLIMGDLYLWRAALTQSTADARKAAERYYHYLTWHPGNYKPYNHIGRNNVAAWGSDVVRYNRMMVPNYYSYSSNFTTTYAGGEVLSIIPMDSASSAGFFNELLHLYSYDISTSTELQEACISPSDVCWEYSDNQDYCEYVNDTRQTFYAEKTAFSDEQVEEHYMGDLRMCYNYSKYNMRYNNQRYELQNINKIGRNIILYRVGQVYLRLAEAMNMAGFPKFALAILRYGMDDNIIKYEVLPQCTNKADSTWIESFSFPVAEYSASIQYDAAGRFSKRASAQVNNIGLHSRGSGDTPWNERYYSPFYDEASDSSQYHAIDQQWTTKYTPTQTGAPRRPTEPFNKTPERMAQYEADVAQFIIDSTAFFTKYYADLEAYNDSNATRTRLLAQWHRDVYLPQVMTKQTIAADSLIDIEQALECCFEGNRFGDLMRAALWRNQDSYLANKLKARNPSLQAKLASRQKWFISWKGQIGY